MIPVLLFCPTHAHSLNHDKGKLQLPLNAVICDTNLYCNLMHTSTHSSLHWFRAINTVQLLVRVSGYSMTVLRRLSVSSSPGVVARGST